MTESYTRGRTPSILLLLLNCLPLLSSEGIDVGADRGKGTGFEAMLHVKLTVRPSLFLERLFEIIRRGRKVQREFIQYLDSMPL